MGGQQGLEVGFGMSRPLRSPCWGGARTAWQCCKAPGRPARAIAKVSAHHGHCAHHAGAAPGQRGCAGGQGLDFHLCAHLAAASLCAQNFATRSRTLLR